MILVTGATGHLGKATIDFLVKKTPAQSVAALVRDTAKAEPLKALGVTLKTGDYSDPTSLAEAFKGVDTLLLISSGTLEDRVQQHINAIDAAKANGVKHIIYTSVLGCNAGTKFTVGIDHYHTEEYLKKSGVQYTLFRNTYYTDILPMLLGDALTSGNWFYAAGQARVNFASRLDMAEALANVLAEPAKHVNRTYEITASRTYSFSELAEVLSGIAGKPVTYIPVSPEDLKDGMRKAGLPELYIPLMASLADSIAAGEFDLTDPALEVLLGRKPADVKETLGKLLAAAV